MQLVQVSVRLPSDAKQIKKQEPENILRVIAKLHVLIRELRAIGNNLMIIDVIGSKLDIKKLY